MPDYQYTPTVEDFSRVSAAAILFSLFLVRTAFSSLFEMTPKKVASGLVLVLAGLISIPQHPTIHRIAKAFGIKSHDTLEQCVMHKSFQVSCIISCIVNYLVTMLSGTPSFGYLILDDVLCARPDAKKLPYVYRDYDYVSGKYTLAQRMVFLIWSNGFIKIPIGFALWHKATSLYLKDKNLPYKTKNQLARELITKAIEAKIPFHYIAFETWYAGKENLRFCLSHQVKFVTSLKSNTLVRFVITPQPTGKRGRPKRYDTISCQELSDRFPTRNCHKYPSLYGLRARRFLINLKGVSKGIDDSLVLVMVRKYHRSHLDMRTSLAKRQQRHPHKYILTNMTNLTTVEAVCFYQTRWNIEVFFRDLKQHFGLSRCMGRTVEFALRHLALICLAYTGMEIYRNHLLKEELDCDSLSVGESKLALFSQLFFFKQNGEVLLISPVRTLNSKELETFLEVPYIGESDNHWWSEKLMKQAFLTSS